MKLTHFAANLVARQLGIPCEARESGDIIEVAPSGVERNEGFSVHFRRQWRSAEASFVPGKFAKPLIRKMGHADQNSRGTFVALVRSLPPKVRTKLVVNGTEFDALSPATWPAEWSSLTISATRGSIPADSMSDEDWAPILDDLVLPAFAMSIALIGIEECDSEEAANEGARMQQVSTRYERKKINRDICLRIHGRVCSCCQMKFSETYGEFTRDFIEVHHIEPISKADGPYKLNPVTDLLPVCSNCHSVLHLSDPPMAPVELRRILEERRKQS